MPGRFAKARSAGRSERKGARLAPEVDAAGAEESREVGAAGEGAREVAGRDTKATLECFERVVIYVL